jgi:hypothetical protein
MNKFLNQFNLTPMQRIDMESFIFTQADKMLEGYGGGKWASKKVGDVWILALPVNAKQPVTLNNYAFGGSITTDHLTASVCFSSIVTNWYMNLRAEQGRIRDENIDAIDKYASALRSFAHAKDSGVNTSDFFSFLD